VSNAILERRWVSADARSKIAQINLPRSRVKGVLTELNGGPSGVIWMSKKPEKFRLRYYWLQATNDVEKCRQCDVCTDQE
jgi:hypothetical protein